ncbi:MAG: chromate resistance protein [Magnetococcus sp. YQC-3]
MERPLVVWHILVLTLPTANSAVRVRVWRALKGMGCGVLRDGVYLLPEEAAAEQDLRPLAAMVAAGGGVAHILHAPSRSVEQEQSFIALFDRQQEYTILMDSIRQARQTLASQSTALLGKSGKRLRRTFNDLKKIDFFPGEAQRQVETALEELEGEIRRCVTPDEPSTVVGPIPRVDPADFRGRIWATRQRLWVDRMASAWLIHRFIDPEATFLWLEQPTQAPSGVVGFDFDGATFTHTGGLITFETLLGAFALDGDPALVRLGRVVHAIDAGGVILAESVGIERVLEGLRQSIADDDALLQITSQLFDGLYRTYAEEGE